MPIEVIVPVPQQQQPQIAAGRLASSPATGAGRVLGLVDNGKHRADEMLTGVAERLVAADVATSYFMIRKASPAHPVTPDQLQQLQAQAAMVLAGVGD